jgi:hypothetical protein
LQRSSTLPLGTRIIIEQPGFRGMVFDRTRGRMIARVTIATRRFGDFLFAARAVSFEA